MVNQGYPKTLRLLQASEFKVVFDQPDCKTSCREFLLLARFNDRTQPRLGLVIGKKSVRRAVARNLIKRLMREQFRLRQHDLPALDLVLLARRGADKLDAAQLATQLAQLIVDAGAKANRRQAAAQRSNSQQNDSQQNNVPQEESRNV